MNSLTPHIIFVGIAFFQVLFILLQWVIYKRDEYLLYIVYIISIVLFILCRVNDAISPPIIQLPSWVNAITYQPLGIFSYWMYLRFARNFLNLKKSQPKVYQYTHWMQFLFISFIILSLLLQCFTIPNKQVSIIYFVAYIPMILLSIPMFTLLLQQKNILNNFLVIGCFMYVLGGFVGMFLNYTINSFQNKNLNVFICVEIGILVEMLLLNAGFIFKNKILQQQSLRAQQKITEQILKEKRVIS